MLKILDIPSQWHRPMLILLIAVFVSIAAFSSTWLSIVAIWNRSETFAHGFLVAPISVWLVWNRRENYRNLIPSFSFGALIAMSAWGFVWLIADLVDVLVIKQWAVVGILTSSIWATVGTRVAAKILFPLLFLFFMVPFGEQFIPWLMDYTATFVVAMLRLTGISVYREGTFFTLTSGQWSVVEGCSGLRYLIASFTLGTVYAYLNYNSLIKRAVFMLASFLVPILANGLRAYMIVMIGHLSSMKLATGVDHIIYGWVFFGLVMLLLFYVGSFWHENPTANNVSQTPVLETYQYPRVYPLLPVILLSLIIWPLTADALHKRQAVQARIPSDILEALPAGANDIPDWDWRPEFKGVMADARRFMADDNSTIGIYLANFGDETQGGELVNSQNYLVPQKHKVWNVTHKAKITADWMKRPIEIDESRLTSAHRDLLVWRWYRVGAVDTSNDYYAKWLQLLKRLSGDAASELMIVLYTETPHDDYERARQQLRKAALVCCS
ncbi:exosortase A [Methylomonas sp. MgM2]